MKSPRTEALIAIVYLLAVTVVSYGGALSPRSAFLPADLLLLRAPYSAHAAELDPGFTAVARPATDPLFQFYPSRKFLRDSLRSDSLPLWNPLSLSGTPFAADDQSAVFYPLNWLYALLPLAASFGWIAALHTFLTGLFFWAWGRRLGWGNIASLCGATVWMLCGVMVAWQMWQVVDDTLCWLPLALYFWEGYRAARDPRPLIGVAVSLALSLLAGHLQFGFYVWLTTLAYMLYRPPANTSPRAWLPGMLGALALGAGLAFVQIAATADMLLRSLRGGAPLSAMLQTAMPLKQLVMLIAPDLFGGQRDDLLGAVLPQVRYNLGNYTITGHGPFIGNVNLYELTCYCGATALVLAVFGLRLRERGDLSRLWLGIAVFALLMACGSPLFTVFYDYVPLFKSFHGAARILALFDFAVAALCAEGVRRLGELDGAARRTLALRAGGAIVMLAAIGFRAATTLQSSLGDTGYLLTHDWMANGHVLRYFGGPLAGIVAVALAAAWLPQRWTGGVLALVAADMFLFAAGFNAGAPASLLFPATSGTAFVSGVAHDGRVLCLADAQNNYQSRLMPNSAMALGWRDVAGNDPLVLARYDRFMRAVNREQQGQDYPAGLGLITSVGSPALDIVNLKYVVTPAASVPASVLRPGMRLVHSSDIAVFQNDNARGDAWLADRYEVDTDDSAVLSDLAAGKGMAASPGGCVLDRVPEPAPEPGAGDVRSAWRDGRFDAWSNASSPKILVTGVIWEPGWRATLDGRVIRPLIADSLVVAAPVPAGRHHLVLQYLPFPLQFGFYVTFACFSIAAGVLTWRTYACFVSRNTLL